MDSSRTPGTGRTLQARFPKTAVSQAHIAKCHVGFRFWVSRVVSPQVPRSYPNGSFTTEKLAEEGLRSERGVEKRATVPESRAAVAISPPRRMQY